MSRKGGLGVWVVQDFGLKTSFEPVQQRQTGNATGEQERATERTRLRRATHKNRGTQSEAVGYAALTTAAGERSTEGPQHNRAVQDHLKARGGTTTTITFRAHLARKLCRKHVCTAAVRQSKSMPGCLRCKRDQQRFGPTKNSWNS